MPRKSPYTILLTSREQVELQRRVRRYTLPYNQVMRAKIVLLAAEGLENVEIAKKLDMPREIVSKWRKRFFEHRLDGLGDAPRRGRPPTFSPSGGPAGEGAGV